MASRLSEDPEITVLVVEAGRRFVANKLLYGQDIGCPDGAYSNTAGPDVDLIQTPFFATSVSPSFDWNYTTVPQAALENRTIPYPRGFVLGGSSSISSCTP